jgi:hypothetical protein
MTVRTSEAILYTAVLVVLLALFIIFALTMEARITRLETYLQATRHAPPILRGSDVYPRNPSIIDKSL